MKNKKIILVAILIILIAIAFFIIEKTPPKYNNDSFDKVRSFLSCAKEGETIGASGMPNSCCSGLKLVGGWPGGYNGDCALLPPPGGLSTCAKCGDDICDTANRENKCNCPEDCK